MATEGIKISEMPELTTPSGDEYVPVVDVENGKQINKKLRISKIGGSGGGVGKVDSQQEVEGQIAYGEIFNVYDVNIAIGVASHAEGTCTIASGSYSHAEGISTIASAYAQHAMGSYNTSASSESSTSYTVTNRAFIIGNGSNSTSRGDAFYVLFNGETHADGAYSNNGADYAEMFEWEDGNVSKEDRVGYFVTLQNDKIKVADSRSGYILGIVSSTPMVIGDNPLRWYGKYLSKLPTN